MDLLSIDTVRTRGRAQARVVVTGTRELTLGELESLRDERGVRPPPVKKLRERHHALARCLADGLTNNEAALTTGYDPSRISILLADPAFKDLIAFYRSAKVEQYADMHQRLAVLGTTAVDELQDRLEEAGESFSANELLKVAEFAADRSGYGPSSKQEVSHTVNFGARLEAARRRMIDVSPGTGHQPLIPQKEPLDE